MTRYPSERPADAAASPEPEEVHEAFDPEPIRSLPPDEPQSPLWLPVVGLGLLLAAGLGWALLGDDDASGREGQATAGSATARATATAAAEAPRPRPRARPPEATANPQLERRRPTPDEVRRLKQRIDERRKREVK